MRRKSLRPFATAVALGSFLFSASWSSGAVAADREDPEVLIRNGVALRKVGEDLKAHGYFQRAYELAHTARTAAQLGLCDLAVGEWLDAEIHLTEALSSTDPWVKSQRGAIESSRARARLKLGRIQIVGAPSEATVSIADRPAVRLSQEGDVWTSPGTVRLRVEAPGYQTSEKDVVVSKGSSPQVVDVRMARLSAGGSPDASGTMGNASASGPNWGTPADSGGSRSAGVAPAAVATATATGNPEAAAGRSPSAGTDAPAWRTPVVLTAAGLAAVSLGLGIYEHLRYNALTDDFNDNKVRTPPCGESTGGVISGGGHCQQLAVDGNQAKTLTIIGYVGAGVLAAGSLIVYLATTPSAPGPTTTALSCAPAITPGPSVRAGVTCGLRF